MLCPRHIQSRRGLINLPRHLLWLWALSGSTGDPGSLCFHPLHRVGEDNPSSVGFFISPACWRPSSRQRGKQWGRLWELLLPAPMSVGSRMERAGQPKLLQHLLGPCFKPAPPQGPKSQKEGELSCDNLPSKVEQRMARQSRALGHPSSMGLPTRTLLINSLSSRLQPSCSNQPRSLHRRFLEDGRGAQTNQKDSKPALPQKARGGRQSELQQGVTRSLLSQQWLRTGFSSCSPLLALQMNLTMSGFMCRATPGQRSYGLGCLWAPLQPRGRRRPPQLIPPPSPASGAHPSPRGHPRCRSRQQAASPSPASSHHAMPTGDKASFPKAQRNGKAATAAAPLSETIKLRKKRPRP